MSVLPVDLIQKLGLEKIDEVNVRYADNSVRRKEVYGWIILEIAGRKAVFDVLAENEGGTAANRTDSIRAIGFDYRARKVIPNPRSSETPMIEIFMASSLNKRVSGSTTFGCSDQNHVLSEMADKRRR